MLSAKHLTLKKKDVLIRAFAVKYKGFVVLLEQRHAEVVCVSAWWPHAVQNLAPCAKVAVEVCDNDQVAEAAHGRNHERSLQLALADVEKKLNSHLTADYFSVAQIIEDMVRSIVLLYATNQETCVTTCGSFLVRAVQRCLQTVNRWGPMFQQLSSSMYTATASLNNMAGRKRGMPLC